MFEVVHQDYDHLGFDNLAEMLGSLYAAARSSALDSDQTLVKLVRLLDAL